MKTLHFRSSYDIKIMIMTSYFRIRDDVIKIVLNFSQDFYPSHIPTKFQNDLTWIRKKFEKFALLIMFLAKHSPIYWLPWQQWMTYPQIFNLKDDLYNGLKSHKATWRSAEPFLRYLAKTLSILPPPPVQIGLNI